MSSDPNKVIRIVAALVLDEGKALLVRKRGTRPYMQPGGKVHDEEGGLETLDRELQEELGCKMRAGSERLLGHFEGPAANEPDAILHAQLYAVELLGKPTPLAEIEQLIWIDVHRPPEVKLAPFTEHFVLPWARSLCRSGQDQ